MSISEFFQETKNIDLSNNTDLLVILELAEQYDLDNVLIMQEGVELASNAETMFNSYIERKTHIIEVDDRDNPIYEYNVLTSTHTANIIGYNKKEVPEEYADLPDDWAMCLFGYIQGQYCTKPINGEVRKIRDWNKCLCMGIARKMFRPLIDEMKKGKAPVHVSASKVALANLSELKVYGVAKHLTILNSK